MNSRPRCRGKGCNQPARFRDVCLNCYRRVERMVKSGELTWEVAEQCGMVGPCRNRARQLLGVNGGT